MPHVSKRFVGTDIQSIVLHEDGYAWEATVRINTVHYHAWYVAGLLFVELASTEQRKLGRAGCPADLQAVRDWALRQVMRLPEDWLERHEKLHGLFEGREAVRRVVLALILKSTAIEENA
ncbi:MAG: hypothetical protein WCY29_15820 [Novosphingobium sp.]